jgi:SAM-dependent methyltransferase
MRDTDYISIACVHSPAVVNFHSDAKGGEPIEPEELGEWGVPRGGMIGRSREREGGRQHAAAIAAYAPGCAPAAPYSAFADVYDFLIGDPAFSALQRVFRDSIWRFGLEFRTLADVGCGTGRFLAELCRLPVGLIGVDRSPSVLAVARWRLAGCPVLLLHQDIRSLSLPRRVDVITCRNQTINYLTVWKDLALAFRAIARSLRRGGAFLFDFIAPVADMSRPARIRETIRLPQHEISFAATIDPVRDLSVVRIRVRDETAPGCGVVEVHRQRWFSPSTIVRLLNTNGFCVLEVRPVDGSQESAWRHVVARRV